MSKTEIPSIRFYGFDNDWEQRKVSDLLVERNEQAPMSDEYPLMAFIANEGVAPKGERYDRSSLVNDTAGKLYKKTEFGDFIYSSNNLETGSIGLNKYGNACISPVYSIFQPTGLADSDFIGRRFVRKDFINAMVKWRQGVIYGQWKIHESDFLKIEVSVPSVEEQRKIGAFLDHLDDLITLHQRKFEKLTNVKKSMLEKMFPKDGADVPEVRFKGFTGAWKRKRFSELYESVIQKNDLTYGVDKNITVASMQYRPDIKVTDIEYLRTYNVLKLGDIAFEGHQSKEFRYGRFVENDIGDGIVSHIFAVFRPKTDYDLMFWKYAINNERIMRPVLVRCTKASTMMNDLVSKDFLEESILVPDIEEQKKIGTVLSEIDRLISLQQEELKKLQSFKKALLEKMFV